MGARLEAMQKNGDVIDAPVLEANRVVRRRRRPARVRAALAGCVDRRDRCARAQRSEAVKARVGRRLQVRVSRRIRSAIASSCVDRDRPRICLSIKRLGADPWERHVNQLDTGQTVDATVTRVMPYGAFACVADGVEGLIHVSESGRERVADPSVAVRAGDVLPVIVAVDRERRRLVFVLASRNAHEALSASRTQRVANV